MLLKKLLFPGVMILALALTGCDSKTEPPTKIAIINTGKIFKDSDAGKAGAAHLDALGKELQTELATMQAAVQKDKDGPGKLQERLSELQQRFEAEQQMVITTLNGSYQKAVDDYREVEKIDIVFNDDTALSYSPKIDITSKVIAKMNLTPVKFTPLSPDGAPMPATNSTAPATQANATAPAAQASETPAANTAKINATAPTSNATAPAAQANATAPAAKTNATGKK